MANTKKERQNLALAYMRQRKKFDPMSTIRIDAKDDTHRFVCEADLLDPHEAKLVDDSVVGIYCLALLYRINELSLANLKTGKELNLKAVSYMSWERTMALPVPVQGQRIENFSDYWDSSLVLREWTLPHNIFPGRTDSLRTPKQAGIIATQVVLRTRRQYIDYTQEVYEGEIVQKCQAVMRVLDAPRSIDSTDPTRLALSTRS